MANIKSHLIQPCCLIFVVLISLTADATVLARGSRGGFSGFSENVYVRGYARGDGTYVPPHYRSAPDGSFWNNWSTEGNVNPYTGREGTRVSPSPGYGGDFYVNGYYQRDGAYVAPHYRSAPDVGLSNNWNTGGNAQPNIGNGGTRVSPLPGGASQTDQVEAYGPIPATGRTLMQIDEWRWVPGKDGGRLTATIRNDSPRLVTVLTLRFKLCWDGQAVWSQTNSTDCIPPHQIIHVDTWIDTSAAPKQHLYESLVVEGGRWGN